MLSLYNYLTEAENAPITYPNLYKPKEVWKIREDNVSYYGRPDNGYLTASFVMEKNLKWPDLGFNLTVQVMNGGRSLIFLTKEDAELFLKKASKNYQLPKLIVAHGRGGEDLVRVDNDKIGIPIYIAKGSIEWLSKLEDTKVPQYIRDRLTGEVEVSDDQKHKEEKERIDKEQKQNFNDTIIKAVRAIDPNLEVYEKYGSTRVKFKKGDAIIDVEPGDDSKLHVSKISFPNISFGDRDDKENLRLSLMPDIDYNNIHWYNSCILLDNNGDRILYPKLSLRRNWDVDRTSKEINNYLDNIINIITNYTTTEEFI